MSSTLVMSIIAGIIIVSLIVSGVSYSRQQAIAKRDKQVRKLRQLSDEMIVHVKLLMVVDFEYQLLILFQSQVVEALKKAHGLHPQEQQFSVDLNTQKQLLSKFQEKTRPYEAKGYLTSDTELNQAHFQLAQISKAIDICQNRHVITKTKSKELKEYISRLNLDLDINSHLKQAERYGKAKDVVMYQLHIKQAREALKKTKLDFEDKNARIKELTDILNESKKTNKIIEDLTSKSDQPSE